MGGKALFFDLDGTLWDRDERIPPATARALERARLKGHLVFINTGRTRAFALRPALWDIGLDGMVTGCGTRAEILRPGDGELSLKAGQSRVLYEKVLPLSVLEPLVDALEARGFRVLLEGADCMYADMAAFRDDPYMVSVEKRAGDVLKDLKGERGRWRASKMTCDMRLSPDREEVLRRLSGEWNLFRHGREVCEIVPAGHDKAAGMRRVCSLLGIPMEDTVAFGDGANDVDMLLCAGCGVCMGGGDKEALAAADMAAPPFGEGGVEEALRRLGLA